MSEGLLSHDEFIGSIILNLNESVKMLTSGDYISFCGNLYEAAKKLQVLKQGISDDIQKKNETIEQLKKQLKSCGCDIKEMDVKEFIEKQPLLKVVDHDDTDGKGGNDHAE